MITFKPHGVKPPSFEVIKGGVMAYMFESAVENEIFGTLCIGNDIKQGSTVYPAIWWCPTTTNAGTVRWGFEFTGVNVHDGALPDTLTVHLNSVSSGLANNPQEIESPSGFPAPEPDTVYLFRFFRDGAHGDDDYPDKAAGLAITFHYESDRCGHLNRVPPWDT